MSQEKSAEPDKLQRLHFNPEGTHAFIDPYRITLVTLQLMGAPDWEVWYARSVLQSVVEMFPDYVLEESYPDDSFWKEGRDEP